MENKENQNQKQEGGGRKTILLIRIGSWSG